MSSRSSTAPLRFPNVPALDGVRGLAAVAVVVHHCLGAGGAPSHIRSWFDATQTASSFGYLGVDLFFVLSAYLITEILLREMRLLGRFDIKAFYLRRMLRIWPLYFAFLGLTFLFAQHLHTEAFPLPARLMFLFFVGNWQFVLGRTVRTVSSLLWSVCLEEQFYLVWPLLLRRWLRQLPLIGAGAFLLATVSRLLLYLHGPVSHPVDTYWKGTFTHLDPIVAGSLVAFTLDGRVPQLALTKRLLILAGGFAGVLAVGWFGPPWGGRALLTYPVAAISCAAILVSVLRPTGAGNIGLFRRCMVHLGRISYGLYVFHGVCLTVASRIVSRSGGGHPRMHWFVRDTTALVLTVLVAECSYHVLELPFLLLKERFSTIKSGPASLPKFAKIR